MRWVEVQALGEGERMSPGSAKMQGWLYLIRSNRFGLQYSRKRYFVLNGNSLNCFKSVPSIAEVVDYVAKKRGKLSKVLADMFEALLFACYLDTRDIVRTKNIWKLLTKGKNL